MDNIAAAGEFNFNQAANLQQQIPIDLFVSKKDRELVGRRGGTIRFIDSSANLVFNVLPQSHHNRLLVDSSANPLISIRRDQVSLSLSLSHSTFPMQFSIFHFSEEIFISTAGVT